LLRAVPPLLAAPLEVRAQRLTTGAILDTYLGRGPGREVLHGAIQRGDLRRIDCAVLLTDLRGFTGKTERWPPEILLHALDTYFEAVADAVSTEGGDVIKFVGDGVLAIFPVEAAGNTAAACKAALNAALQARDALKASNDGRSERGEEPLDFGCGLHIGEVAYGNIGGRDRLDFTVIGAAVNVARRLQELCKTSAAPSCSPAISPGMSAPERSASGPMRSAAAGARSRSLPSRIRPPRPDEQRTLRGRPSPGGAPSRAAHEAGALRHNPARGVDVSPALHATSS
jgi:adenylate cyclase